MANYTTTDAGTVRVLIRRKQLGTTCRTFQTMDAARAWGEAEEALMMRRVLEVPAATAVGITLREAWLDYSKSLEFKAKAPSSQRRERQAIVPVLDAMGGLTLAVINRARLKHYFAKRGAVRNPHRVLKDKDGKVT